MDTEQARFNMVEQQIRPWNVLDQRVLDLMTTVPRETFVPHKYSNLAFMDTCVPLPENQVMMSPKMEARMMQALAVKESDVALEIGTGSGYVTALLAHSCQQVISIEIHHSLAAQAEKNLSNENISNASIRVGNGINGWDSDGPYDVVALTGSAFQLPDGLKNQLRVGGRLFAIVGDSPVMEAQLIVRVNSSEWVRETLFETSVPALIGGERPKQFRL